MKATFLLIFFFSSISGISATEIFAVQSWELIKDVNLNGWVDEGDIIRNTVEVTQYGKNTEGLRIINNKTPYLSLIPGTVKAESGNVVLGNNSSDEQIEVAQITIAQPWGRAKISYDSEVRNLAQLEEGAISDFATVIHSSGSYNTDGISIPVLSKVVKASADTTFLYSSTFRLIVILFIGLVLGVFTKRISLPRLSFE